MLLARTVAGRCSCSAAPRDSTRSIPDALWYHVRVDAIARPAHPCSRTAQEAGLWRSQRNARHRRPAQPLAALPPDLPSSGTANPQQVWPVVQQVWQALANAATSQPPSDADAAAALQNTGNSAWRTLLTLHLLRSGCNAAQLSASASASVPVVPQQSGVSAAAALQPQVTLAVAAKDPGGSGSGSGSSGSSGTGGRGSAVQPPSATAQLAAGQSGPGGGGGGGGSGKAAKARRPDIGTLWGLLVLGLAYVHHSTTGTTPVFCKCECLCHAAFILTPGTVSVVLYLLTCPTSAAAGFALPALLPLVNEDLHLTDAQGALLTSGYTVRLPSETLPCDLQHRSCWMVQAHAVLSHKSSLTAALTARSTGVVCGSTGARGSAG